ncbi:GNAT family N-acetyltransferase [candidate division KSB1 bacterium]|nr:GNAT family N-acetyltransferase [candidate division KSB1 bacterium]
MHPNFEHASLDDASEILALQKQAYQSEAEIYNDYSIQPLTQTIDEIYNEFTHQTFLKATIDRTIVVSVRAYEQEGTCYIGKVIVHPDFQNQGIGARLLQKIEQTFSHAKRYELFTGARR